jgi:hypothetical protein
MVPFGISPEPTLHPPPLPVLALVVVLVTVDGAPSFPGATTGGTVGVVPLLTPASAFSAIVPVPWLPSLESPPMVCVVGAWQALAVIVVPVVVAVETGTSGGSGTPTPASTGAGVGMAMPMVDVTQVHGMGQSASVLQVVTFGRQVPG